ncbi:MAG: alpha-galactosidase [Thomasclavelia sp.]
MSITFHKNNHFVHMKNEQISYIIEILDRKYLVHRYFGKSLREFHDNEQFYYFKRAYTTNADLSMENASFDDIPSELPTRGRGDFRTPILAIVLENGIEYLDLHFKQWKIVDEKPLLEGLPSTFANNDEVETLEIVCEDDIAKVRVYLYYSIFKSKGLITRHQKIENYGCQTLTIQDAKSISLDLPHQKYDWISLYGTHAKEANIERFALHHGIQKIESVSGSSSPQHQPFFALVSPETNQFHGEVFGFHLVYSGNFIAQAQVDQFGRVRAQIGINPDTFTWKLKGGEIFTTPEAVLNYSQNGLNEMSQNFHWLYQYHLMPKRFENMERPILLNSWEAMYYDVSLAKIDRQTDLAKQIGVELFVLDDGWFRSGNTSESAIGDWKCNEAKLPGGIKRVSKLVHDKGLKFGLWFEPEAVSKNSQLYEKHPDWILNVPQYSPVEGRHEYLLDLSREDVRNYIINIFDEYLKDGYIDYVKWDMNRPLTDVNSLLLNKCQKGEIYHRYVLGLYEILEKITTRYSNVLFEGCSSGGGRFDPGILYYVGQNWCSDNTDGFDRVHIQSGFGLLYPPISMGAHISITPNHQTGRWTSLDTRYKVAKLFNLGFELDLEQCCQSELDDICNQIIDYKKIRHLILNGLLYQHDTFHENYVMWSLCDKEGKECIVMIFQKYYTPLSAHGLFKIPYLDAHSNYCELSTLQIYGGDELQNIGISVPLAKEDFHIFEFHFVKI